MSTKERYFKEKESGRIFCDYQGDYHPTPVEQWESMTKKAGKAAYREQAKANLLEIVKPGMCVYTILRSVSQSGMSRVISLCVVDAEGTLVSIDHLVALVCEYRRPKRGDGLIIGGCGMDMGFAMVDNLAYQLFRKSCTNLFRPGEIDLDRFALGQQWV